jgi:hypothetical protein
MELELGVNELELGGRFKFIYNFIIYLFIYYLIIYYFYLVIRYIYLFIY